jgi:hypothetical protein
MGFAKRRIDSIDIGRPPCRLILFPVLRKWDRTEAVPPIECAGIRTQNPKPRTRPANGERRTANGERRTQIILSGGFFEDLSYGLYFGL